VRLMKFFGGAIQWNVSFTKGAHDWEVEAFASFYMVLYLARLTREGEYKLWWVPSKKRLFAVKFFYSVMGCHDGVCLSWKSVWRTKVPLRVTFFGWSAALGKILIVDNLCKRHVIMVDWYCLCKRDGEVRGPSSALL